MAQNDVPDPFAQLEEWATKTDRRVRNDRRRSEMIRKIPVIGAGLAAAVVLTLVAPPLWSSVSGLVSGGHPAAGVPAGITVTTSTSEKPTNPFVGTRQPATRGAQPASPCRKRPRWPASPGSRSARP
jgi:hypothetical protein